MLSEPSVKVAIGYVKLGEKDRAQEDVPEDRASHLAQELSTEILRSVDNLLAG